MVGLGFTAPENVANENPHERQEGSSGSGPDRSTASDDSADHRVLTLANAHDGPVRAFHVEVHADLRHGGSCASRGSNAGEVANRVRDGRLDQARPEQVRMLTAKDQPMAFTFESR